MTRDEVAEARRRRDGEARAARKARRVKASARDVWRVPTAELRRRIEAAHAARVAAYGRGREDDWTALFEGLAGGGG